MKLILIALIDIIIFTAGAIVGAKNPSVVGSATNFLKSAWTAIAAGARKLWSKIFKG